MIITDTHPNKNVFSRLIGIGLIGTFCIASLGLSYIPCAYADALPGGMMMPAPGQLLGVSKSFNPCLLKGIKLDSANPFKLDFIVEQGDAIARELHLKQESSRLIQYFLASLTIPESDLWVNLSPYESDQMITDAFGKTIMGNDLLAQDYLLKQLTASLTYPESPLGKKFWSKAYQRAQELMGTTRIPINTFNKVWIMPESADIYEDGQKVVVTNVKLKVMLESDYTALKSNQIPAADNQKKAASDFCAKVSGYSAEQANDISSAVMREVIVPAIEDEVNNGKNFAQLRQITYALILAAWFKRKLKESVEGALLVEPLSQLDDSATGKQAKPSNRLNWFNNFVDKKKTKGVDSKDPALKEKIYQQYLEAYRKGVYNFAKKEFEADSKKHVRRRYYSGGFMAGNLDAMFNQKGGSPVSLKALGRAFTGFFTNKKLFVLSVMLMAATNAASQNRPLASWGDSAYKATSTFILVLPTDAPKPPKPFDVAKVEHFRGADNSMNSVLKSFTSTYKAQERGSLAEKIYDNILKLAQEAGITDYRQPEVVDHITIDVRGNESGTGIEIYRIALTKTNGVIVARDQAKISNLNLDAKIAAAQKATDERMERIRRQEARENARQKFVDHYIFSLSPRADAIVEHFKNGATTDQLTREIDSFLKTGEKNAGWYMSTEYKDGASGILKKAGGSHQALKKILDALWIDKCRNPDRLKQVPGIEYNTDSSGVSDSPVQVGPVQTSKRTAANAVNDTTGRLNYAFSPSAPAAARAGSPISLFTRERIDFTTKNGLSFALVPASYSNSWVEAAATSENADEGVFMVEVDGNIVDDSMFVFQETRDSSAFIVNDAYISSINYTYNGMGIMDAIVEKLRQEKTVYIQTTSNYGLIYKCAQYGAKYDDKSFNEINWFKDYGPLRIGLSLQHYGMFIISEDGKKFIYESSTDDPFFSKVKVTLESGMIMVRDAQGVLLNDSMKFQFLLSDTVSIEVPALLPSAPAASPVVFSPATLKQIIQENMLRDISFAAGNARVNIQFQLRSDLSQAEKYKGRTLEPVRKGAGFDVYRMRGRQAISYIVNIRAQSRFETVFDVLKGLWGELERQLAPGQQQEFNTVKNVFYEDIFKVNRLLEAAIEPAAAIPTPQVLTDALQQTIVQEALDAFLARNGTSRAILSESNPHLLSQLILFTAEGMQNAVTQGVFVTDEDARVGMDIWLAAQEKWKRVDFTTVHPENKKNPYPNITIPQRVLRSITGKIFIQNLLKETRARWQSFLIDNESPESNFARARDMRTFYKPGMSYEQFQKALKAGSPLVDEKDMMEAARSRLRVSVARDLRATNLAIEDITLDALSNLEKRSRISGEISGMINREEAETVSYYFGIVMQNMLKLAGISLPENFIDTPQLGGPVALDAMDALLDEVSITQGFDRQEIKQLQDGQSAEVEGSVFKNSQGGIYFYRTPLRILGIDIGFAQLADDLENVVESVTITPEVVAAVINKAVGYHAAQEFSASKSASPQAPKISGAERRKGGIDLDTSKTRMNIRGSSSPITRDMQQAIGAGLGAGITGSMDNIQGLIFNILKVERIDAAALFASNTP